jgi:branched-subunit amino acid aminotransferase/4-amino-4-deoxychorismate lyase
MHLNQGLSLRLAVLTAIDQVLESSQDLLSQTDAKLTVLLCADQQQQGLQVHTHLERMKPRLHAHPVIHVELASREAHRTNAALKDSKWAQDRKSIVNSLAEDTLLVDSANNVLEGSQTNFFAVLTNGTLMTAEDGILKGTVRAAVLDACEALRIPVLLHPPPASMLNVSEAFLASTSRLVLPIDSVGDSVVFSNTERPVTTKIAKWVEQHVQERSVDVKSYLKSSL